MMGDVFLSAKVRECEVRGSCVRVAPWLPLGEVLSGSVVLESVGEEMRAGFVAALTDVWLGGQQRLGALTYHGRRDGMTATAFHGCCDGKGPTLTLIRSENGCVFGGYVSSSWEAPQRGIQYVACDEAFLFSVVGPFGSVTQFPLRAGRRGEAMSCSSDRGPSFGDYMGFNDLEVRSAGGARDLFDGNSYCYLGSAFVDTLGKGGKTFTGTLFFFPTDIEVYAVL
ncbi:MAG: TLD domain-containing protein [Terracidiphilus sp.]|nr:TLD domain-containing protein [Terracidiphilus sp.]